MADSYKLKGERWENKITGHEWVEPDQLLANPLNARIHNKLQQDATAGLLNEVGWVKSIQVNQRTGHILDGHLRVTLALRKGEPVPVEYVDIDEADEAKALASLDYLVGMADYDKELLDSLLREVQTSDEALQAMLAELAAEVGLYPDKTPVQDVPPQTDRAEELQAKWGTAENQIWSIGDHFVICGDCRQPETWQRLLSAAGVQKVNGVFTSPPYAEQRKEQYGGIPASEYVDWWEDVQACVRGNLTDDGSFFVNIKAHCEDGQRVLYVMDLVCAMVRRWGWRAVDEFCWLRPAIPMFQETRFKNGFEPVHQFALGSHKMRHDNVKHPTDDYFSGGGIMKNTSGGTYLPGVKTGKGLALPSNVITTSQADRSSPEERGGHSAAFPVALPDFFIRAYSDTGDVWIDPFLGSGTTIVAAHQNNRRGLGIEMLPKYLGVILERLSTATSCQPVRVE